MKFRKKPVVIEAVQFNDDMVKAHIWDGVALPDGVRLGSVTHHPARRQLHAYRCVIDTLEGQMRVENGDWIICGVKGEFYPCKPDIFAATYEPVAPPPHDGSKEEP